jgi:hypothetical protein
MMLLSHGSYASCSQARSLRLHRAAGPLTFEPSTLRLLTRGCLCLGMGTLGITMLSQVTHYQPVSIDHDGDVPVYIQLADILRARIEAGELAPRRPVPSKRSLQQEYGVAGGTIDKAIARRGPGAYRHRPRYLRNPALRRAPDVRHDRYGTWGMLGGRYRRYSGCSGPPSAVSPSFGTKRPPVQIRPPRPRQRPLAMFTGGLLHVLSDQVSDYPS